MSDAKRLEKIDVVHYEEDQDGNHFALLKEDDYWFLKEQAERAQELEGFTVNFVNLLKTFWRENNQTNKQMNAVRRSGFRAVEKNEQLQEQIKEKDRIIDVMDGNLVRCGLDLMKAEDKRAQMQWEIDRLSEALEEINNATTDAEAYHHTSLRTINHIASQALEELK